MLTAIKTNLFFCTTADVWSACRRSYMGVTLHFFDRDFYRVSYAIGCVTFPGKHDYYSIGQTIQDLFLKFGLTSKNHILCVSDNGSNFVKSFRLFGLTSLFNVNEDEAEEDEIYDEEDDVVFDENMEAPQMCISYPQSCFYHRYCKFLEKFIKMFIYFQY